MKKFKKLLIIAIIFSIMSAFLLYCLKGGGNQKGQYLNSINYNVVMQEDGSMVVTETWDIYVENTNTLFKTFNISNRYGNIHDVQVTDLEEGKRFNDIETYMYHVTTGCFYALEINSATFEIAWGTGMEETKGRKKYKISYVVDNVVTDYNDCQEIYWKFLGLNQNAIPAKKVTGTIILPQNVSDIENLRVWGHGQLNGIIEKISGNKVKFELDDLKIGAMLEIRVVTQDKMFNVASEKIRNYSYIDMILEEEKKWSDESNELSDVYKYIKYICLAIYVIIGIIIIKKIKKYKKIYHKGDDGIIKKSIGYFRDIPRKDISTPGEAAYLYNYKKERLSDGDIQKEAVSATILDLCLKKKIKLTCDNQEVFINFISTQTSDLNDDEKEIYNLLRKAGRNNRKFNIEELNEFAKKEYYQYSNIINKFVNNVASSLFEQNLIDKNEERLYYHVKNSIVWYGLIKYSYIYFIIMMIMAYIPYFRMGIINSFGDFSIQSVLNKFLIIIFPLILGSLIMFKIQSKIGKKISVLTQKGYDEKQQWNGLRGYLKDYSLLKEKRVDDLAIWEEYLVYATALGISEKVLKEIKANYPEVFIKETWMDENQIEKYPVMYFISNSNFKNNIQNESSISPIIKIGDNVSKAYAISATEIARHSSSSGSGGGGGFSGGGGGRWWPEDGMGGR
ncbi:MAG: DUF2207 family protein [Candidatus Scatovivens sp.]